MKLKGIFGKGSGKLGNAVFAVSGGEQLVKEYNPRVSNPNTPAQVEQRAKFKLLSQLATALAPALAYKKNGLVSARNQFVSKNIASAGYEEEKANVALSALDLTGGARPKVVGYGQYDAQTGWSLALETAAPDNIKAVVYVLASYDDYNQFGVVKVALVVQAGNERLFPVVVKADNSSKVLYCYGIVSDGSEEGFDFDETSVNVSGDNAELAISSIVRSGTAVFTKTYGTIITP